MLTLPQIIELPSRRYVAIRQSVTIPFDEIVAPAYSELFGAFASRGIKADGMRFTKFNLIDMPSLEIEIGATTDAKPPLTGWLVEGELPAGHYASMTYTGPYDGLIDATTVLIGWAKEKGLRWDAEPTAHGERFAARLEIHENDPATEPDPNKLVTTLLFKLADQPTA